MRPRYAKLRRDLWATRGRVALMIAAIAVALTGVGAILSARAVVLREAAAAYAGTAPASATLDVAGGVDAALLAAVRQRPGVVDAAARQTVATRVRVGDAWRRMLLFVIPPDDPLRVTRFRVESGAWPPPDDGLLLERTAVAVLGARAGGAVAVAGPGGGTTSIRVTGTVHDPALAPAWQERTGYGYLTPAALARLGHPARADELKIIVGDGPGGARTVDQPAVDRTAADVAAWLRGGGHAVHRIAAPPYRHPHQNQTDTVTTLFLVFALAALVLAAVLVAATLGSMLAAQTRQIGVMKSVGATSPQLFGMYLGTVAGIAAVATGLALAPGLWAGGELARLVAGLLNIDLADRSVPAWVFATVAGAGLAMPLLVALVPLVRAARLTVRAALDDHGVAAGGGGRLDRALARVRVGGRTTALAVRGMVRRRARLAFTLTLLIAAGALFTTGLNTASSWSAWVAAGLAKRTYDADIRLASPAPGATVAAATNGIDGVTAVETATVLPATPAAPDGTVETERTYPDGGHGAFALTALPPDTALVDFDLLSGRWLRPGDTDAVVLNQSAATRLRRPAVGDEVRLAVEGHVTRWRVVGVVAEVGGPATAYTAAGTLDTVLGRPGAVTAVRVRLAGDRTAAVDRLERALAAAGAPVSASTPTSELRDAADQHVVIFINTLIALAVLMAVVGVLGLASAMGIAVTERTREYGIMRAVGASPAVVRRLVFVEGLLTGATGGVLAVAAGVPLSVYMGGFVGRLAFGLPLPLDVSYGGIGLWAVLAVVGAGAATALAARRAGRLTIPETLAHV